MRHHENIPETLQERVRLYVEREHLLDDDPTLVVAVSGGVDSVAMLDVLVSFGSLDLHVAHVDHGIRPKDSEADAEFVEHLAGEIGLPFHGHRADCPSIARDQGLSLEEAGRKVRRTFLRSVAKRTGANRVATGHHRNDQAETVLLRLLRGSSATGLSGIRPISEDFWIRPFLTLNRIDIEVYAQDRGLSWRRDWTNQDTSIPRNRIRNILLPILKADFGPHVLEALNRTADLLRSDDELLESIALDASKTAICARSDRKIALDGPKFFGYHVAVQRRLIRWILPKLGLDPRRIEFSLIDRILTRMEQGRGTLQVTTDLTACNTGRLVLLGVTAPVFEEHITLGVNRIPSIKANLTVEGVQRAGFPPRFSELPPYEIWFDHSALPKNLILRTTRPGDRIRPFGFSGSQKVSDILIDRKLPRLLRDEVPVLADRDEILWIIGIRSSERSRIEESATRAVRFNFEGSWRRLHDALQPFT